MTAREIGRRAANYFSYLGSALGYALRGTPPDLVLCMTDPPIIGDLGVVVGRRFGVPVLVISQDVFPEIATELGRLQNPAVIGVLRTLVAGYLRRADRIVAIGETMRRRLEQKGAPPDRLRVIPNWVDTSEITPQPRDNSWAEGNGLVDRFVVMHSGNVGHAQDLDSLVRAATFLRDLDDLLDRRRGLWCAAQRDSRAGEAPRGDGPSFASSRTSSADGSRSRFRAPTCTSSGSRRVSRATSYRAACTGSLRPGGR